MKVLGVELCLLVERTGNGNDLVWAGKTLTTIKEESRFGSDKDGHYDTVLEGDTLWNSIVISRAFLNFLYEISQDAHAVFGPWDIRELQDPTCDRLIMLSQQSNGCLSWRLDVYMAREEHVAAWTALDASHHVIISAADSLGYIHNTLEHVFSYSDCVDSTAGILRFVNNARQMARLQGIEHVTFLDD